MHFQRQARMLRSAGRASDAPLTPLARWSGGSDGVSKAEAVQRLSADLELRRGNGNVTPGDISPEAIRLPDEFQ